ncbi:MAG: maleylpyruvate isomerase family mycothiol-dependent enzyme [Anaerolineales bacterium]|nr:maleylpyruvate isomerase family mycothiol-dependent enzyme [Anaerolineales bacterium]
MTTLTRMPAAAEQIALEIPGLTHAEAGPLSQTEYERTLAVIESLQGDDWVQPTYCTAWNVRDMTAHLAGAVTGSTSLSEFIHQNVTNAYLKEVSDPVDGINRLQLEERAGKTPAELVAEFRRNGQIAVNNRQKLPWVIRKIHLSMGTIGFAPLEYLLDTMYPRDQWMHRYDICAATGKKMIVTPEHDGRIVALVVRDIARKLKKQLAERSVLLQLRGALDGDFLFGRALKPDCTIEMDFFDFNLRASGRMTVENAFKRGKVSGDHKLAEWFISGLEVTY